MVFSCEHCCTKITDLGVKINNRVILEGIDLHLNCREILALIGPNGAGKTTLLRAILGEIKHTGKINFLIKSSRVRKPLIGYVPQKLSFDSDSPITVLDLISISLSLKPVWLGTDKVTVDLVKDLLGKFYAQDLINRKLSELSGGELQRVLLALAMTPVPDILLLDEPVSAVDVNGLSLFYEIVTKLKQSHDISIIMATHDIAGVASFADRMVLLNRGIIADGTPQEVFNNSKLLDAFQLSLWNISKTISTEVVRKDE